MSTLSRRSLVTSAAALPVLAMPAVASEAIGPNHPDAELLRLGAEFDGVGRDWLAQRTLDRWEDANDVNVDPDLERWSKINNRLFPIAEAILEHKAATLAGLAVLTHALALVKNEWWDDEDFEVDHAQERGFVESVCSMLGIIPAPVADRIARKAAQS